MIRNSLLACLLAAALAGQALAARPQPQAAQAKEAWSQGWQAYSSYLDPRRPLDRAAREGQLTQAWQSLSQAAALQPQDPLYAEAAGYLALQMAKYPDAEKHLARAWERAGREPRLRLLLGQVYSCNLAGAPDHTSKMIKKALDAFTSGARLDPDNATLHFTAASVLLDAGSGDWPGHLDQALAARELRLYLLPLPEAMPAADALRLQLQFCSSQAARVLNVARGCQQRARADRTQALSWLAHAQVVALRLAAASPALASVALAAVTSQRQAEEALLQVGAGSPQRLELLQAAQAALAAPAQALPRETDTIATYLASQRQAVQQALLPLAPK